MSPVPVVYCSDDYDDNPELGVLGALFIDASSGGAGKFMAVAPDGLGGYAAVSVSGAPGGLPSYIGHGMQFLRVDSIETGVEWAPVDLSSYLVANTPITGATKTKITYDANGLVTAGADATATDVGLGNCDNTSDANKPVSTAQATAIQAAIYDAVSSALMRC